MGLNSETEGDLLSPPRSFQHTGVVRVNVFTSKIFLFTLFLTFLGLDNVSAEPLFIAAGESFTCEAFRIGEGSTSEESVRCWGKNDYGQAKRVNGFTGIMGLSVGYRHACLVDKVGVSCWGRDFEGQTSVPYLENPRAITTGSFHSCAIDEEGAKCWGSNARGQSSVPPGIKGALSIAAGAQHTCVIYEGGIKCFGSNDSGQTNVPSGLRDLKSVSAGGNHTCAIDRLGLKCWGGEPLWPDRRTSRINKCKKCKRRE